jgi:hypothetical protein
MSYYRDEQSRGVGAVASLDMGPTARISGALQRAPGARAPMRPVTRAVAPVRTGPVPALTRPAPQTGINIDTLTPMRQTVTPSNMRVGALPPALHPVAIVTPAGQPMARVAAAPTAAHPARVSVTVSGTRPAAPRMGTATTRGGATSRKPVWVTKASDCPRGYFIKRTVVVPGTNNLKFWCWPNPAASPTPPRVVRAVARPRPVVAVMARPTTPRGGLTVGTHAGGRPLRLRGPVIPAPNVPPLTSVNTPAGPATVIATPQGNVAVPGAVVVPMDVPVGSTVSTDAGPATVTNTPAGNVAIPESMAPPEDAWADDSQIDALLSDTKDETGDTGPAVDEGPAQDATPAEAAASTGSGGIGKLAMIGGAGWLALKFFL